MKVELDVDETWELMSVVVARMLDGAKVPESDRAKVRRWRSDSMRPGGEQMRFTRKVNEDLAQAAERKKRSQIRKPDWR